MLFNAMKEGEQFCSLCGKHIEDDVVYGDSFTFYEGKPLCSKCYYEDEPAATIYYGRSEEPCRISQTRNETDGEFWVEWSSSDLWRGRYVVKSNEYRKVFSDSILAYHESETMLKELNDMVVSSFEEMNLDYARSFARTSNVFCTDFDIWTKNDLIQFIRGLITVESVKGTVDYYNPLYSTGIIFDREIMKTINEYFKGEKFLRSDAELLKLLQNNKNLFQEIIKKLYEGDF